MALQNQRVQAPQTGSRGAYEVTYVKSRSNLLAVAAFTLVIIWRFILRILPVYMMKDYTIGVKVCQYTGGSRRNVRNIKNSKLLLKSITHWVIM